MSTTIDDVKSPATEPPVTEPTAIDPGEPIDMPGWNGIVSRPNCNCSTAAYARSWVMWSIGATGFLHLTTRWNLMGAILTMTLLFLWAGGQDPRVVFRGGWWRRPRAYAFVLTGAMMIGTGVLMIMGAVEEHRAKRDDKIRTTDGTEYIPVRDLPDNAYVDGSRVILVDPKDER